MLKGERYQESQKGNYQLGKIKDDLENVKIGKNTTTCLRKKENYLGDEKAHEARRHSLWHTSLGLELPF